MKASTDLDQACHSPSGEQFTTVGLHDPRYELQERRLAGSVQAENGDGLAFIDDEVDPLERLEHAGRAAAANPRHHRVLQREGVVEEKCLPDPARDDARPGLHRVTHRSCANLPSSRRKTNCPAQSTPMAIRNVQRVSIARSGGIGRAAIFSGSVLSVMGRQNAK